MPLFHYCSNATFLAILKSRSVRLSSLSQSNDSMEGKLIAEALARLATSDQMSLDELTHVQQNFVAMEEMFSGRALCLSQEGDLLSQWRGYASNGSGVSIGFSEPFLRTLESTAVTERGARLSLLQVLYDPSEQDALVRPAFNEIKSRLQDATPRAIPLMQRGLETPEEKNFRASKQRNALLEITAISIQLLSTMYQLKSRGFFEEREWRLLCHARPGQRFPELYAARDDQLVPFDVVRFPDGVNSVIEKVILGPKNQTPLWVIREILSATGFEGVRVVRSVSSYR